MLSKCNCEQLINNTDVKTLTTFNYGEMHSFVWSQVLSLTRGKSAQVAQQLFTDTISTPTAPEKW